MEPGRLGLLLTLKSLPLPCGLSVALLPSRLPSAGESATAGSWKKLSASLAAADDLAVI